MMVQHPEVLTCHLKLRTCQPARKGVNAWHLFAAGGLPFLGAPEVERVPMSTPRSQVLQGVFNQVVEERGILMVG